MISITNGSVTDGAEPPKQIENSRPVIKIIAMENVPFTDDFPKTSIFNEFFMAMLNNQREIYI
jgi:hypothetical protein